MTPDRRAELRRLEDANFRTTASHDNEVLKERIKALESLLARFKNGFAYPYSLDESLRKQIISEIDAILPKTEEVK